MANKATAEGHLLAADLKEGNTQRAYDNNGDAVLFLSYEAVSGRYKVYTPVNKLLGDFHSKKEQFLASARKLFMQLVVDHGLHFPDKPSDEAVTASLPQAESEEAPAPEEETYNPQFEPVTPHQKQLFDLAQRFRGMKNSMFAERGTMNEVIDYAVEVIPFDKPAAVTIAMMTMNTMLEYMACYLVDEIDDDVIAYLSKQAEENKE